MTAFFKEIVRRLQDCATDERVAAFKRIFKAEDGSHDRTIMLGCRAPDVQNLVRQYHKMLSMQDILALLQSEYFEVRSLALSAMVLKFKKNAHLRPQIIEMYLANTHYINNWGLVDVSAYKLLGHFFEPEDPVFQHLADSKNLWENRIAVVSTLAFIKQNKFDLTLKLCRQYLTHKHHLIHKACGWMLREVGKKDVDTLVNFLNENHQKMPRIMLSYSREKLRLLPRAS